jgi:hypothetical protein
MKSFRVSETFVHHGPNGPGNYFRIQRPAATRTEIGRVTDEDGEDLGPDMVVAQHWEDVYLNRTVTENGRPKVEKYIPYFTDEIAAREAASKL